MASPLPWLGWLTGAEPCQRAARDLVQDCLLNIRSYPITGRSPIRHLGTRLVGVLSSPEHGYTSVGRPYKTYIDVLSEDAGLNPAELKIAMQDRDDWRRRVNLTRAIRPIR